MKKIITLFTTLFVLLTLFACNSSNEVTTSNEEERKESTIISVACSPTPHGEILEKAKDLLANDGIELRIVIYDDYVQPIEVVESQEIDANYFAHVPYLNNYNNEHGTKQVVVGKIHYEPFGIYPGTKSSLEELEDGDVIFIPNDGTNETRALLLLEDNGIITLPSGTGADTIVTVNDIENYNINIDIRELEAAQISRVIDEAAVVILNGNYALGAGLNVSTDAIAYEKPDSSAAKTYVNVIAVTEGNENNEGILALVNILHSKDIIDFINSTYEGAVVPFEE